MLREKLVIAVCKHCGIQGPTGYSEAQKAGWKIAGEDYYCPKHTNSPLTGPQALQQFAQHLKQFVDAQERKRANLL